MSKKIELKPVPLGGSRANGKPPTTVSVELGNNANPSKRNHFPQPSQDDIKPDEHASNKQPIMSKKQRQAQKEMEFPEPEFELDAMTVDRISLLDIDERLTAFSEHYLNTMEQEVQHEHKDDQQFVTYFKMAHQIMLKGLRDYKVEKEEKKNQDETHRGKVEGWLSRPDKDRLELRKRESIRQLLKETEGIWEQKIQLQTKGFDGQLYDESRQRIQRHVQQKSSLILEKQKQKSIQEALCSVNKQSMESYHQIYAESKAIQDQQETILSLIEETQQNVEEIERLLRVLAKIKQSAPCEEFGRPLEYRTWELVDALDDYLPPNLITN